MDVSFKKLINEDPKFKKYIEELAYLIITDANNETLGFMYALYSQGYSATAAFTVFKTIDRMRK